MRSAYSVDAVRQSLRAIRAVLPAAAGASIDVIGSANDRAFPALSIENRRGNYHRLDLTGHPLVAERSIDRFARSLSLPIEAARQIHEAGRSLQSLNRRGSWCVEPITQQAPVTRFTPHDFAGQLPSEVPYLERSFHQLRRLIPGVRRILAEEFLVNGSDGRLRRRVWLRFLTSDGDEVMAIDTATIATHWRDGLVRKEHAHLEANLNRLAAWAQQLDVDQKDVPEIIHLSGMFTAGLGGTEIVL